MVTTVTVTGSQHAPAGESWRAGDGFLFGDVQCGLWGNCSDLPEVNAE